MIGPGELNVTSRLNLFLVFSCMESSFPGLVHELFSEVFSDHCHTVLEVRLVKWDLPILGLKTFGWLSYHQFRVIEPWWKGCVYGGCAGPVLMKKLRH